MLIDVTLEELLKIEWLLANYGYKTPAFAPLLIKVQGILDSVSNK